MRRNCYCRGDSGATGRCVSNQATDPTRPVHPQNARCAGRAGPPRCAVELESTEPAAFEAVQEARATSQQGRDRVDRAYMVHASGDAEDMLDEALSNMSLGNVDQHHRARLKRLLERMTRKLAARHGRVRKRVKRGQLAVPATLRKAMATDGVPFKPQWRKAFVETSDSDPL